MRHCSPATPHEKRHCGDGRRAGVGPEPRPDLRVGARRPSRYTLCVPSVADELRRLTAGQVLALTPDERIDLALSLGDADARLFIDASGLPLELASRRLRAARHVGRQRSVAALPLAER